MRKATKITAGILILCLAAASFAGCAKKDENIISIKISEEAKKEKERLAAEKITGFDPDAYYEKMKELYYTRTVQAIPDTPVKNTMNKETYMKNDVYTLDNGGDYENIVLYIHGGAWTYEIDTLHVSFCDELVDRLNAKVYMPLYPLAPEASYYETYKMIEGLYEKLLEQGKPIYVMGDSAGGNISLGLIQLLKKYDIQMPEKLVVLAPCADMTFSNPDIDKIEPDDPILNKELCSFCAQMWAYERELDDPLLSAVYADTTGFPDTMIFAGTNDILYPDDKILYENMKEAGVNVRMVLGEGLWHVFSVSDIPEKEQSLDLIQEFCGK